MWTRFVDRFRSGGPAEQRDALLRRDARVVIDDQEARLRGLGQLGELRRRRVVFGRELLERVGPPGEPGTTPGSMPVAPE